jgi:hypothetical protein
MPRKAADPHRPCPTKWITVQHPTNNLVYKFKLSSHRKGGSVRITFAYNSPTAPDRTIIVPRSRPGYYDFVKAALSLLNAVSGPYRNAPQSPIQTHGTPIRQVPAPIGKRWSSP